LVLQHTDLSVSPDDDNWEVTTIQSALSARSAYSRNPCNFQLIAEDGGQWPVNVIKMRDAQLLNSFGEPYSDTSSSSMIVNHDLKHKNDPQFCVIHSITIGGKNPFNTEAREVPRIKANISMQNEGWLIKEFPPVTLKDGSTRLVTSATIKQVASFPGTSDLHQDFQKYYN
jgi:hypothetical protein